MSASRPPEGHISAEERRKLLISTHGIVLAVVPTLAAVLYFVFGRSFFAGARISQANGIRVDFAVSWAHINDALANNPTLGFEGDDDSCRGRLEELVANLLSQKYRELALPTPLPTMTTSRSP